jgi:putative lipoic acid-binding regulatory protein
MGVFDPMNKADDTELATGSIITALVKFPAPYAFTVVGKTDGEETVQQEFVAAVLAIVRASSSSSYSGGAPSDDSSTMDCVTVASSSSSSSSSTWKSQVTPRGKKYVKVTVEAQVDSASIITSIYQQLETLERCVMKF